MTTKTYIVAAAALLLGSTSAVLAQAYEPAQDQPVATARPSGAAQHKASRAARRYVAPDQPSYNSQEPWSSSFDPGMAGGGN